LSSSDRIYPSLRIFYADRGNVIGTYLHGPLLPKNVWLADHLIELALDIELGPLDDRMEDAAHASARRAAGI
jgi:CobQ-like glutamine amidotransferase family enzyme